MHLLKAGDNNTYENKSRATMNATKPQLEVTFNIHKHMKNRFVVSDTKIKPQLHPK